jgi:V8-like Glu-specific endopeptidase
LRLRAVPQRTIGLKNESESFDVVRRILRAGGSTAKLLAREDGTCSLITSTLVLSNNHVFAGGDNSRVALPSDADGAIARFNYVEDELGQVLPTKDYRCRPDWLFTANQSLDYAVVALEGQPGSRWGRVTLSMETVSRGDDVFIIGHPDGLPREIALANNTVVDVSPPFFGYTADTLAGSSGSPILNRQGHLIGIHHKAPPEKEYNEGVLIAAIYEDLPNVVRRRLERARA